MQVIGKVTKLTGKGSFGMWTEIIMRAIGRMIKLAEWGYIFIPTERGMKESGKMTCKRALALKHGLMDLSFTGSIVLEESKGLGNTIGTTGQVTLGNGMRTGFKGLESTLGWMEE